MIFRVAQDLRESNFVYCGPFKNLRGYYIILLLLILHVSQTLSSAGLCARYYWEYRNW